MSYEVVEGTYTFSVDTDGRDMNMLVQTQAKQSLILVFLRLISLTTPPCAHLQYY